jgi:uncharacterized integral membrane protein
MRIVYWVAIVVAATICGAFAISNRIAISLALWPLPFVIALPVYLLVFAALVSGFVAGAITTWIAGRHRRRTLRRWRRQIHVLESELAATRSQGGARERRPPPLPARD